MNIDFADIEKFVKDRFGIPTEVNKLTGTYRATGVPDALQAAMPLPMSALMNFAAKASQANLEKIFEQQVAGKKGYGVATLDGSIVGVAPDVLSSALGIESPALSGMVPDAPTGMSQSQYEQAIIEALQQTTAVPGTAPTSGVGPTSAPTIGDITEYVNKVVFGDVQGITMGSDFTGVVTSTVTNPLGSDFAQVSTPITNAITIQSPVGPVTYGTPVMSGNVPAGFTPGLPSPSIGGQPGGGSFGYGPDPFSDPGFGTGISGTGTAPAGFDSGAVSTGGISGSSYGPDPEAGSNQERAGTGSPEAGPDSSDPGGGTDWATGGRIGMNVGGTAVTEGFVNKDPDSVSEAQSIADNRYTSVKAGSFVVNQPANEANEKMLDKIVGDATKRTKMKKGGKTEMVDVALSDGERLIEPEVVAAIEKKHGKGFLDKINDAGKPEVKRRQAKYGEKIGAADGGFLADQGMELSDVGEDIPMEDYLPVSDDLKAKLSKFASRKPQRGQIKSFIKGLSPEEKLTVLFLTETQSTTDPIESMEAIGEVVKNRIGSDYYDFKDIKTLDDALLKQTRKGAFHFSGLEPSTLYARAKEVKKGVADGGLAKAYAAAQNVLDPETEGQYRLPAGTVFYTRKDAPSQWMRESKDLEFSTELGGHEFYRTFASPELP